MLRFLPEKTMLVLLTACALLSISAGVKNLVECGGSDGTTRIVLLDSGSELMAVYQLEKKHIIFRPARNLTKDNPFSKVSWGYRYANRTRTMSKAAKTQIRERYNKLLVKFTKEIDMIQVRCKTKGQSRNASRWATLHLGKSPVLRLFNNTESNLKIPANESLTVCFALSGAPRPRISLFHSTLDGIRSEASNTRYKIKEKENCLEFGPVRPQDTGTLTVQATNCFNIATASFSLEVPSKSLTPNSTPNPTPNYDTKNLPYWIYMVIAVGSVVFISLLLFLFYRKCCKKDKSDHPQLAAKEANKGQHLKAYLPEGSCNHLVIETNTGETYPKKSYDCLSASSQEVINPGPIGYNHHAHDAPERQPVEDEYCSVGYENVQLETSNEIHESAYSYATVNDPKVNPEQQPDPQYLVVEDPTCSQESDHQVVNPGPTGYDHHAPDTPERQSVENEYFSGDYENVGEIQTSNEIHESAYSYAMVNATKREPERQLDPQSLSVENKKLAQQVLSDGLEDVSPLRLRSESPDYEEPEEELRRWVTDIN